MRKYFLGNLAGLLGPLMRPDKFPTMLRQSFGLLQRRRLTLREVRPEGGDITTFVFRPQKPLTWQAGQHFLYRIPHPDADASGTERFFTTTSAPHEKDLWITTRLTEPGSTFKQALKKLPVGDTVRARGPLGIFLVDDPARHHVFIAGGIGITPFRAMLSDLDHRGQSINVTLLYSNSSADFAFKRELDALAAKHDGLKIYYFVSPQRITADDLASSVLATDRPAYYVSGPNAMVRYYYELLRTMKVPCGDIRRDILIGY